jgi:endonuclease YncB( thermonuclease family)
MKRILLGAPAQPFYALWLSWANRLLIQEQIVHDRVVGVTAGDTVRVLTEANEQLRIRPAWIDAPEKRQAFGNVSRRAMIDLAFGKDVELRVHATDRYARLWRAFLFDIACGQIDIGNAATDLGSGAASGTAQADGTVRPEPLMDVAEVGRAVRYMANLPLDANVATMTLMATKMPFIGRG